jgi:hypothetical protein
MYNKQKCRALFKVTKLKINRFPQCDVNKSICSYLNLNLSNSEKHFNLECMTTLIKQFIDDSLHVNKQILIKTLIC